MELHRRDDIWFCSTDSAGVLVLRQTETGAEVLMITMKKGRKSFPKGHIEDGETEEAAALREVLEETGIQARLIPGFREVTASVRPEDHRRVIFFLGEYAGGRLQPQEEEVTGAFWCPAEQATEAITFDADRTIWLRALEFYRTLQKQS